MEKTNRKPENELGYLLMQVSLLRQRINNKALRSQNLTYMQFVVLAAIQELSSDNGSTTQQHLIFARQIDKSMASGILKNLISRGLVDRYENSLDTRSKIVRLTKDGITILQEAKNTVSRVNECFFAMIDKSSLGAILSQLIQSNTDNYNQDDK